MQLIQFNCADVSTAGLLISLLTGQANEWSRLQWLINQPEYTTNPFMTSDWKVHPTDPTLYWNNWDAVYANLGDSGRVIADALLKPGPYSGILLGLPLIKAFPDTFLSIVEVEDLVQAGYATDVPNPDVIE